MVVRRLTGKLTTSEFALVSSHV